MNFIKIFWLISFVLPPYIYASEASSWRTPELDNQVYLHTNDATVIIELAPFMAPKHVERFKILVAEGFYNGLDFYRVIDGFVAQGGDITGEKKTEHKQTLTAEFSRPITDKSQFQLEQDNEFMAPQTGYLHGFSAGRDIDVGHEWLLHCPGTLAMARGNEKNSASTEFYIVIGQATRHLDRNMSSFGRVIYGMSTIQALQRADMNSASGVIEDPDKRSKIAWLKMAKDVPEEQRIHVQVQEQTSDTAKQRLANARTRDNPFFHFKGNGNLDMCYYQLKTRVVGPAK